MEEEKLEKPVQVTLPDEAVTEVELDTEKPAVAEKKAKISEVEEPRVEKKQTLDEREKALNQLKSQYEHQKRVADAEREARKKAEEFAKYQAQQVGYARNEVQDSNLKIILNAIDATEQAALNAEREYAESMAAGDFARAAKAQRLMAQAESHLLQLQNGKQRIEETLQYSTEGAVQEPEMPNFEPDVPPDPVEMYASKLAPKSAQWLREHPEVVNKIGRLTRAHQDAVEDGYTPESPEYFNYIENRLGYSAGRHADEDTETQQTVVQVAQPKKTVVSTPVSSNASITSPRSSSPNTMTLSAAEVEMAILAEPELSRDKAIESYARNKAFLIKQGKLSA